jgi:C4-dicarboxylate transporter, DctM subunit
MAVNLLVACRLAQVRIEQTVPHVGWLVVGFVVAALLVALFPSVALWLPGVLGY